MQTFTIGDCYGRFKKIYMKNEAAVPQELFSAPAAKPDCSGIEFPLPSRKKDYVCSVRTDRALWLGAQNGLTRYDANAAVEDDVVMYFSAPRELADNCVLRLLRDENEPDGVWVETKTGVSHIVMRPVGAEEKARMLTEETEKYIARRGMTSQKDLCFSRDVTSAVPYGECDNSGLFTASFAVGEMCRYAVAKRERGENDPETKDALRSATRAAEAALLLMYIPGRGDGFVARTYLTPAEPVPDDGLFYRKQGGKAVCLPTREAKERGRAGETCDAGQEVPARLAHLYRDEGFSDDGIIYKADTSSDEITGHMANIFFIHRILGPVDPELDGLAVNAAKNTLRHIIDHGYALYDCCGKPTTWAKWYPEYFRTELGWSDGCLNSCQIMMYHKLVMDITGETEPWQSSYEKLVSWGYPELACRHDERFFISSKGDGGQEPVEELMYGDHTLATIAYNFLIYFEKDPVLKDKYIDALKGWNGTFRREHNPMYDIPYIYSVPDSGINVDMLAQWFRRVDVTRLCSAPSPADRFDLPVRTRFSGGKEFSRLLPSDEYFVSKHDRNPFAYGGDDYSGRSTYRCENAYLYTLPYWLGRFLKIIDG